MHEITTGIAGLSLILFGPAFAGWVIYRLLLWGFTNAANFTCTLLGEAALVIGIVYPVISSAHFILYKTTAYAGQTIASIIISYALLQVGLPLSRQTYLMDIFAKSRMKSLLGFILFVSAGLMLISATAFYIYFSSKLVLNVFLPLFVLYLIAIKAYRLFPLIFADDEIFAVNPVITLLPAMQLTGIKNIADTADGLMQLSWDSMEQLYRIENKSDSSKRYFWKSGSLEEEIEDNIKITYFSHALVLADSIADETLMKQEALCGFFAIFEYEGLFANISSFIYAHVMTWGFRTDYTINTEYLLFECINYPAYMETRERPKIKIYLRIS